MKTLIALLLTLSLPVVAGEVTSSIPEVEALELPEPTKRSPVSQKSILIPSTAKAGDTVKVVIKGKILSNWHIYAQDPTGVFKVTEYSTVLPAGIEAAGEWELPGAEAYYADPNILIYHNDVLFSQQVTLAEDLKPGEYEIEVKFNYQTCDPYMCLPPKREKQVLKLTVK